MKRTLSVVFALLLVSAIATMGMAATRTVDVTVTIGKHVSLEFTTDNQALSANLSYGSNSWALSQSGTVGLKLQTNCPVTLTAQAPALAQGSFSMPSGLVNAEFKVTNYGGASNPPNPVPLNTTGLLAFDNVQKTILTGTYGWNYGFAEGVITLAQGPAAAFSDWQWWMIPHGAYTSTITLTASATP